MNTVKDIIIGILIQVAFFAAVLAIPAAIHDHTCKGCDWFWCGNYNGK